MNGLSGVFLAIYLLVVLGMFGLSIYCLFLFIKFAKKGIEAFDIYITKNKRNDE